MKILVVGSGGREHALIWKLNQSPKVKKIYCAPGNAGIGKTSQNVNISIDDIYGLCKFAKKENIDLTVVGSEAPLVSGIVDLFEKNHLAIVGPSKKAARIEGSKVYSKKVMLWNKIPTANFVCFDDYSLARKYLHTQKYPLVVKAEGQCLGKGVSVCNDEREAQNFIKKIFINKIFKDEGKRIIIEEYLSGQEVSFMVVTDGEDFVSLFPSQDHKRALDGDKGENTGGMGAYAPVPFVDKKTINRIEKEIVAPTLKALREHGNPYKGILYPGIILTKDGPKVLEYNCRFGDPETQALLPLLKTDLIDIFQAIVKSKVKSLKLKWRKGFSVCVVLASGGYPGKYETGKRIEGLDKIKKNKNVEVFHAGTEIVNNHIVTSGGRVLGVTSIGKSLKIAIKQAYGVVSKKGIHFSHMQFRKDIGRKGLKNIR